jgi:peptidoglycan/xylan/chitin deacetylase (PgdA/CDA1 family)
MKRIGAFLCSVLLFLSLAVAAIPVAANAASTNLVANPSVETSSNNVPTSWSTGGWGTNTASLSYLSTGHTGSHSLDTKITKYTSGDAKWYFAPVAATSNTAYSFSDWYKSTVASEVDIVITSTSGVDSYIYEGAPAAATAWTQASYNFTTPANTAKVTVYHLIHSVGELTTDDYSLATTASITVPTAPSVSVTAPVANATVTGTTTLTATAADAVAVSNVQFKVDGVNVGTADTTSPYSFSWNSTTATNGTHTITAVATNSSNLMTTSGPVSVTVSNPLTPTPPTVSVTAPVANATVTGTTTLSATAADAKAVSSVQFKVDGNNIGTADTTSPYSVSWDSTSVANGTHTVTAVATNSSNLTTTSSSVTITVSNVVAAATNLLANPSFENSTNGTTPDDWVSSNWGTNTSTFSYLNTGHTGNHSVEVQTTAFTSGAANWYYNDVPVTAGKSYKYSNWYKSNVDTEVDAEVTMSDGTVQYYWLGSVFANTNWTQFTTTFTPPAGAKSIAIYQILAKVGYIVSDDYSLTPYTPVPFNRGLVSVTFDDGWADQYANATPVMKQLGINGTYYIISGSMTDQPDYMTAAQVKSLYTAGNEIGSHTVTHPDLTTVSQADLVTEMSQSQTTLQNLLGVPVTDFAYPYGAYNANTLAVGKQYYASQRTVNGGENTKDNLDVTQLKIQEVDSDISQAQVQGWINGAIADKAWLILVYHEVAVTPSDPTDDLYDTQPSDFSAEMNYLKSTQVTTDTVHQALAEVQAQE